MGSWRLPSSDEQLALAADVWMLGAADSSLAGSSTTLVYWASRTLPQNGRAQWLNRKPLGNGGGLASLGNKMLPLCRPPTAKTGKPHACVDTKPNYDRLPPPDVAARQQQELRGAQLAEACLAERFSILSESAAFSLTAQS